MLCIDSLTKKYPGGKVGVRGLTLHVEPGDLYGFIGHNGAGKTTTLRCCAGILSFESGTITIDGHDIVRDAVAAKRVTAYIPDNPDLYEHLTGDQYLSFIASIFDLSPSFAAKATDLADRFELTGVLGGQIAAYSHGMKQKLALVSALMRSPRLMLLDEPFVGLDPAASVQLKQLLAEVCDAGGAVFFSTHVLEVAEKLCNKVAVIAHGELALAGATSEVTKSESLVDVFMELSEASEREEAPSHG